MYTLFGFKGSGSAAVECALEICDAPHRRIDAASWAPESELEALGRINPLRQIPTLQTPQGQVLTESAAILMHLGLAFPASGLLPVEPAARDLALRGLVYIAANCYSCISIVDFPERYTTATDAESREAVRAGSRARLHHHWDVFADLHSPPAAGFLGGARPGALDLLAAVVSKWSGARQHLRKTRPAMSALLERIDAHPAVAAVFARHWATAVEAQDGT